MDCYVTYMDEEFLSVVYNVRVSMEYYGQVYLSCVNINMESGVVMHNLMDLIHVDDAFAIEFRERNARQNQTDSPLIICLTRRWQLTCAVKTPESLILPRWEWKSDLIMNWDGLP